jgi:probable addiction module antidote protein
MKQLKPFEASQYLTDEETIGEFLTASLEDPNPDMFLRALQEVAKARGMTQLAKDAGINRESLYKALAPGAKPRYDTILKLVSALGVKLTASPV